MSWAAVNTPTHPLFRCHGLLRLTEFNLFHNACLMFEVINGLNPRLTGLLPICHPQHQHRTRNKRLITVKQRRLHCTGMSVACKGPQIWNRLDEDLKKLCCVSAFKKKPKSIFTGYLFIMYPNNMMDVLGLLLYDWLYVFVYLIVCTIYVFLHGTTLCIAKLIDNAFINLGPPPKSFQ